MTRVLITSAAYGGLNVGDDAILAARNGPTARPPQPNPRDSQTRYTGHSLIRPTLSTNNELCRAIGEFGERHVPENHTS